jgi:hypothetical protein
MLKKILKTIRSDNLHKKGHCPLCSHSPELEETELEDLYNLFGVEVCEGCYHELINHMGYKNLDDLIECDKKQLTKFLNMLSETKRK